MQTSNAGSTTFSPLALELMRRREINQPEQSKFAQILDAYNSSEKSAQQYLDSLSSKDLDLVRQVNCLAFEIIPSNLNQEGAINLLREPGDALDIDNDGIAYVGAGRSRAFPPQNAPPGMKDAYNEALAAMPGTELEKMIFAQGPFMAAEVSANIKLDSNGTPIGFYEPGEEGYSSIYNQPGFSYQQLCESLLANNESGRSQNSERAYQWTKKFLEMFQDKLQEHGVR